MEGAGGRVSRQKWTPPPYEPKTVQIKAVNQPNRLGRSSEEHAAIARLTAYEGRHAITDTSGATEAALTFAESAVRRLVDSLDPRNVA